MSMPEAEQAAERDEQRQAQVIKALMQGICAVRYRKADNTPCPITQGLYLGSVGAAFNKEALKSLNITHILIVARSLDPVFPSEFNYKKIEVRRSTKTKCPCCVNQRYGVNPLSLWCARCHTGVKYLRRFPHNGLSGSYGMLHCYATQAAVLDSPDTDLLKHSDECFSFIDEAISSGGNVLVHCFAGRSRSVTIVVAYLMKKYRMSLESALSLVRSKRPQVAPNEGFISQLENFQKSLQVEQEQRMQSVQN